MNDTEKRLSEKLGFKLRRISDSMIEIDDGRLPIQLFSSSTRTYKIIMELVSTTEKMERHIKNRGNLLDRWDMMANDTKDLLRETETGFYNAVEALRKELL